MWVIPAERMKARREHRVPLSKQAVAWLEGQTRVEGCDLLFPGTKNQPLSDMTLTAVMRRMEMTAVPHGFRSHVPRLGRQSVRTTPMRWWKWRWRTPLKARWRPRTAVATSWKSARRSCRTGRIFAPPSIVEAGGEGAVLQPLLEFFDWPADFFCRPACRGCGN